MCSLFEIILRKNEMLFSDHSQKVMEIGIIIKTEHDAQILIQEYLVQLQI